MYEHVLAATPALRALHAQQEEARTKEIQGLKKEIADKGRKMEHDQNTVPPGIYRISVVINDLDFLLSEIKITPKGGN